MISMLSEKMKKLFGSFMKCLVTYKKTILLVLTVMLATLAVSVTVSTWLSRSHNINFPSIGTIMTYGVKVYWDSNLENETAEIQWGTIYPSSTKNVTLYVRSISTIGVTLALSTENWTFFNSNNAIVFGPSINFEYMNLTWNYDNASVSPGEVVQATLTLSISSTSDFVEFLIQNDVRRFSFDISIRALE